MANIFIFLKMYTLIGWLANSYLLRRHPQKTKVFLMVYPLFVVTRLNHWIAGFVAVGCHIFLSSLIIKWIENETGLSVYAERVFDLEGLRRIDAMKVIIMLLVSGTCIAIFSRVDPVRLLFISGVS